MKRLEQDSELRVAELGPPTPDAGGLSPFVLAWAPWRAALRQRWHRMSGRADPEMNTDQQDASGERRRQDRGEEETELWRGTDRGLGHFTRTLEAALRGDPGPGFCSPALVSPRPGLP